MKAITLQVGDQISVRKLFYKHVGIYIGPRYNDGRNIVHNDKAGGVVLSTLEEFSGGSIVHVEKPATGNWFEREAIAERALSLLGKEYNLAFFNCEHAANWAQKEKAESPQLVVVGLIAIIGLVGLALASSES